VRVGVSPGDSWELATPQLKRYYVKGGPLSHGQHGYIVSNANWDPYPMANKLESFVIALANMDIAVMLRIGRFSNPFFTGVKLSDVLPNGPQWTGGYHPVALQQEMQSLTNPVAPFGAGIVSGVEDLQAQTLIKVEHARRAVDTTLDLLAQDLLTGSVWMDARRAQNPQRNFGPGPTALWGAFRKVVPLPNVATVPVESDAVRAAAFLRTTDPAAFYTGAPLPRTATERTAASAAQDGHDSCAASK
jgi:histidine ammonia-lyase